jgi:SAM-dependent methyltransferase
VPDLTELAVPRSVELLGALLPPPPARLLEVGCGNGALAAELRRNGWRITGLDPAEDACAAAEARGVNVVQGTLPDIGGDWDALLFTRSLHHVPDLVATVQEAVDRLGPGGRIVLEDFARERADRAAAEFLYDTVDLLEAAGLADPADDPVDRPADPLARWHRQRGHLHTELAMVEVLSKHGDIVGRTPSEALWRLALSRVITADGAAIGRCLRDIECRRIDDGTLPALGFVLALQT